MGPVYYAKVCGDREGAGPLIDGQGAGEYTWRAHRTWGKYTVSKEDERPRFARDRARRKRQRHLQAAVNF